MNNNSIRHFDPLKNKLPPNWTNSDATKYYNRCSWNKCKCDIRINTQNPCFTGDKWDACGKCDSKWTRGCNPCSDFHKRDNKYYHTYNRKNCGCSEADSTDPNCSCAREQHGVSACPCDDEDIVVRYVANNSVVSCNNLVEFKYPPDGSKARYVAKFSEEFIDNNRFHCAIPAVYNHCPGNLIDNRREEEFTESDQRALVSRNIRNKFLAERVTTRIRYANSIPMSTAQNGTYYYIGGSGNRSGSNQTGLYGPNITGKPYFDQCNC